MTFEQTFNHAVFWLAVIGAIVGAIVGANQEKDPGAPIMGAIVGFIGVYVLVIGGGALLALAVFAFMIAIVITAWNV